MLMRDGRVTETQLNKAIEQQRHDGGRIGTVLVEMGIIDLDTLTVYLGLELGIPIATGATMDRAKRSAVRLLSPEQATRFRCVPIVVQDRQLIAAIDDPHDLVALDDLTRVTGYRIIPRVAPEIRIFYYLERYYGVARPPRFKMFGDVPRGSKPPDPSTLPAPPLPGLPPQSAAPVRAPTPPPVLRTAEPERERETRPPPPTPPATPPPATPTPAETAPAEPSPEQEALEIDAEDLLVELEADDAQPAVQLAAGATPPPTIVSKTSTEPAPEPRSDHEPLDLEDAVAAMRGADERGAIADAIMSFAAGLFDIAALCIVRDNMAFGWMANGAGLDSDRIETLLIPLDVPSIFQTAVKSEENAFHDRPFPATLHNYLFKVLRCEEPDESTVSVISIGKRVVNILYGHRYKERPLSELDMDGLRQVCRAATEAYVRLIAVSKKSSPTKAPAEPAGDAVGDSDATHSTEPSTPQPSPQAKKKSGKSKKSRKKKK